MLYHYTNLQGLLGILNGQSLWASHCEYLNDSNEYYQAINFAKSFSSKIFMEDDYLSAFGWVVRDKLENMQNDEIYVTSFSQQRDFLSQWRGYSSQGGSVCIGFDKEMIQNFCNVERYTLSKCIYSHEEQKNKISQLLDECLNVFPKSKMSRSEYENLDSKGQVDHEIAYYALIRNGKDKSLNDVAVNKFLEAISEFAPTVKNYGFHEEAEWRIIARNPSYKINFRASSTHLIPYINLPIFDCGKSLIKEIIVGPNPNSDRCVNSIKKLLASCTLEDVEIKTSEIPFSNW